ncbi:bifunctional nitrate reductase/sulfite reductase flavoprotein subunit alpha [Paenibacillus sp. HWE-109]|uniref:bifunctional nitrate reductase/sulfite reductase flavoprotein subunit alpha n=1 Tax=Paenibacillus sp. HWE-109 TaxID=1306526 RepID=UPI001EE02FE0|nr:bifunctional nitrate reductase/sulfite reductase flavoprotein subunit alpha [Paenibacillus sp. HWE-109]UKS30972.1 bifunctional nitrate reductase/sulfite reductase flavoprotein subunit alpha [Paenibacillus sp. HWE-109]
MSTTSTKKVKSVCPYCGVGCGIILEVLGNRVLKVTGDKEHPTNYGRLCTKGNTCAQAIAESGRMEYAYKRPKRNAAPLKISIQEAIHETASQLRAILDRHGPDALSFYVSGQMSLEAQYLINKLAKGFVRTNNIESNSRLCMASAGSGYKLSLGSDGPPGSYQDMDQADLFFVIGANMADCHPILFLRVMDRVKAGAKLIVVDPRRNATADKASLFMQIKPGTDLALLNGLLHLLLQNGHTDAAFIADFTAGWETMPEFLEAYTPSKVADITGIAEADIRLAAQWIGESPEWMSCWTMGLNQSTHGTWHTNAICNLHLATGKICRPGSGPFSLTGQPNAMGGREMGYMGPGLPGQRSVLVESDRTFIEEMWKIPRGSLRTDIGTGTVSMFQSMQAGDIKACWIICTNPVATVPNRKNVIAGLQKAELVITQDAYFETETNRYADIMLPGALWSEAEGVMINSERNLTRMQKAIDPPGEALPDWQIIAKVACEMGYSAAFTYSSSSEVYQEIQQAWNAKTGYDIRGATYERLLETPMQWPCAPDSKNDRNPIRYLNDGISQNLKVHPDGSRPALVFPTESGRGVFLARPYLPPAEMPDSDFPFVLNTGRLQHQWHTMTKTGKIPMLNKLNPGPFIEIHPEDAQTLGIKEQDRLEIRSRRGLAVLPAAITDRVRPGNCFAPFHWNDIFGENLAINDVTNDAIDPISFQPEFKYCAVSLIRVVEPLESMPSNLLKEVVHMAQIDTLASMLGIQPNSVMTLESHEKTYLSGFITSLRTEESRNAAGIPVLPPTAPLEPIKRYWLDGLLAGIFSRTYLPEPAAIPMFAVPVSPEISPAASQMTQKGSKHPVTIVWASQTGNAEGAAHACAKQLQQEGYDIRLVQMNAYALDDLPNERHMLFIASTFGAGDPPDNGESFWQMLKASSMPRLSNLRFAVLAFGDTNYDLFCGFGRNLDARLEELGAYRLLDRTDCDTDYQEQLATWIMTIARTLNEPPQSSPEPEQLPATELIKNKVYDRNHPLRTTLIANRRLNPANSEKETRHFIFDLKNSGMRYEAGDALGVWPTNCPDLVDEILAVIQVDSAAAVTVKELGEMSIAAALLHHYEIVRITPGMLRFIQERSSSEVLGHLLKNENKSELKKWLWGRQLVDVLQEFPISISAIDFLDILKPMQPRLYSISSSPQAGPDEVHITVSTVRYSYNGKSRKGVCSAFLADRAESCSDIPVFVQKTAHFRPPANPDIPMIMIGPGTGVGPFRGFMQERKAVGAKGKNWLIFGEQRAASDFYFKEELQAWQTEGILHRLDTAFSRDQPDKIYVQHRMIEHGAELWEWLQEGAHFYICGDASQMAKEVEAALKQIIQQHSGMTSAEVETYLKEMSQSKRYAKDVY